MITALCMLLAGDAHAGAWTRDLGSAYVKGGADVYKAVRYVIPGTNQVDDGTFFGQQYGLYAEVGLLPTWRAQLAVAGPLTVGTATDTAQDAFGDLELRATTVRMGDLRLMPQVAIHPELPLAAQVEVKIPMYRNGEVGTSSPVFMDFFPLPGDGQVDLTGWVLGGASPSEATFVEGGIGYRHRTEWFVGWAPGITFVDGLTVTATGGARTGPVLWMLKVDGIKNLAASEFTREFLVGGPAVLVDLGEGVALEGRFAGEVWARNASQGIGGGVGVSWRTL